MTPTLNFLISGLTGLTTLVSFGLAVLKLWAWRRHQQDKAVFAHLIATASEENRSMLQRDPPDPPPDLGILMVVTVGGALASMLLAAHGGGLLARSAPTQKTCQSSQDCEKGQRCERGICTASAHKPPRGWADAYRQLGDGTICADRVVPPWQDVEPEAFPDRPPAVEVVAGYRFQH